MGSRAPAGQTRERIYRFVRERIEAGHPPTVREVQAAMGFRAVQSAREHLEKLVAAGRLVKRPGRARGYGLPEHESAASVWVPLLGRVAAGELSTAIQDLEGHVPVRARSSEGLFALRVQGESMIEAGILPEDLVIVRAQPTAQSGDIVVALVEDEATVKRLRLRRGRLELHPENEAYEVIVPPKGQCKLLGKVIELRRSLEA